MIKKYILCPLCKKQVERQIRFKKSDKRFGEAQPQTIMRNVIGSKCGRTEKVLEKPQGNAEQRQVIYYCNSCRIGWRPKDVIRKSIRCVRFRSDLTVKEYKKALNAF